MKILITGILLLCSAQIFAQGVSVRTPGGSVTMSGSDFEISQHQIQQQNTNGEIILMSEKEFNASCNKQNIDIKSQNVWGVFWLPKNSQNFVLYIKQGSVNAKHMATVRHYIDNVLYIKTWEVIGRQGYSEFIFKTDSRGNTYYKKRNDWTSGSYSLPNGNLVTYSGPTGYTHKLGELPFQQTTTKERTSPNTESYIYMADPIIK